MKRLKDFLVQNISVIIVLLVWELLSLHGNWDVIFFPPPSKILNYLFLKVFAIDSSLVVDVFYSTRRLFLGAVLAIPLAVMTAIFCQISAIFNKIVYPMISLTYPIPKIAILPFLLFIMGLGDSSKITIIALGIYYLVLMHSLTGLYRLKINNYFLLAKSFNITGRDLYFKVILRGILPELLEGIKLGGVHGLVLMVASEFSLSQNGVGFYMWNAWDQFRILDIYAGLVILTIQGHLIFLLIDNLKSKLPESIFPANY